MPILSKIESQPDYNLIVVGAGSGGIGAAIAAGRLGLKVLLIEKQAYIGGNVVQSGVSVWEMGVGGTGIPFEIYKRLKRIPGAVGIYRFNKHRKWQQAAGDSPLHPGAEIVIDPSFQYADSLLRHGSVTGIANEEYVRKYWHGVVIEPAPYVSIVEMMLEEANVYLLKNTTVVSQTSEGNRLISVGLSNGETYTSTYFIDATDSGFLCRLCGCDLMYGQESQDVFGEPDAPPCATDKINGVTLIYRISGSDRHKWLHPPGEALSSCWWAMDFPLASIVQYPNGDFNVNMLPTMEGNEFNAYSEIQEAYTECRKRVFSHFEHIKRTYPPYADYGITWIAPSLGVRESHRVQTVYVLSELDILAGLSGQRHDDCITIADHPMDTHGRSTQRGISPELKEPYGVPFRCMIPVHFENLLIASRAAGFSSLAASSCRLSRTMMQLGQAAGTAAWLAHTEGKTFPEINRQHLRSLLKSQHVQLEFPISTDLFEYLANE